MKYEFIHPKYHEVNITGCAHVRVVQMNHTHGGAGKYSCLQAKKHVQMNEKPADKSWAV